MGLSAATTIARLSTMRNFAKEMRRWRALLIARYDLSAQLRPSIVIMIWTVATVSVMAGWLYGLSWGVYRLFEWFYG